MVGNGYIAHLGTQLSHPLDRPLRGFRSFLFNSDGLAEALLQDADPDSPQVVLGVGHELHVILGLHASALARIRFGRARNHLEQQCGILNRQCKGTAVVKSLVDAGNPNVGNQAVGGLEANHSAPGGGNPDRATLISADGRVHPVVEQSGC